jgi:hypothetical protein
MKKCQISKKESNIKLTEAKTGRKAIFKNELKENIILTSFDGCVVKNDTAADFVLSKTKIGDLIVELKGRDVEHGATQVMATAEYLTSNKHRNGLIAALIVCRKYPKEDSIVQRRQLAFAKKFKGPLKVSEKTVYEFEKCFSFT